MCNLYSITKRRTAIRKAAGAIAETGHGDPGDCFLIATARVRGIPIVTLDSKMVEMAGQGYLRVIEC